MKFYKLKLKFQKLKTDKLELDKFIKSKFNAEILDLYKPYNDNIKNFIELYLILESKNIFYLNLIGETNSKKTK